MPEFNCYMIGSSSHPPLMKPWPACGILTKPNFIYGTVSYNGTAPNVCPAANGTYNAVWTPTHNCSFVYITAVHPVAIGMVLPGFASSEHATSGELMGFITNYTKTWENNGSCVWTQPNGPWVFFGGMSGFLQVGNEVCTMVVVITGVG